MASRKLRARVSAALPRLGWVASIPLAGGDVEALHGESVERADDWLVEGVWDAPFGRGEFHASEAFFGSGLRLDGERVVASASTALVDRLLFLRIADRILVSNSLVILLAVSGARLDFEHDYARQLLALLAGVHAPPAPLRVLHPGGVDCRQLFHGNLVVTAGATRCELRSRRHPFATFEAYETRLGDTLARLADNLRSPARRLPMAAFTTLSAGYDSVAVGALAREHGVAEAFTTCGGRSFAAGVEVEDGAAVARALGLRVRPLAMPGDLLSPDEPFFLASSLWGSELAHLGMHEEIAARGGAAAVFTGYFGGQVWSLIAPERRPADDIRRGDDSGLGLSEARLVSGFVHVAVPYLFARSGRDLATIGASLEMSPWRLGGEYDRPIPRRLAESRGVPRTLFGQSKRVVWEARYELPWHPVRRAEFESWLCARLAFGRPRLAARTLWRALDGLRAASGLAPAARPPRGALPTVWQRRLFAGRTLRELLFHWSVESLTARLEARLRAEGSAAGERPAGLSLRGG